MLNNTSSREDYENPGPTWGELEEELSAADQTQPATPFVHIDIEEDDEQYMTQQAVNLQGLFSNGPLDSTGGPQRNFVAYSSAAYRRFIQSLRIRSPLYRHICLTCWGAVESAKELRRHADKMGHVVVLGGGP